MTFHCNTCLLGFDSISFVKDHYRTDLHVLNSKRRTQNLSPTSPVEFEKFLRNNPRKPTAPVGNRISHVPTRDQKFIRSLVPGSAIGTPINEDGRELTQGSERKNDVNVVEDERTDLGNEEAEAKSSQRSGGIKEEGEEEQEDDEVGVDTSALVGESTTVKHYLCAIILIPPFLG
jgi:hypothetical protein